MVRKIKVEPILKKEEFLAAPEITKEEIRKAMDHCIKQVDLNMEYFKNKFPYSCCKENHYPIIENIEWTDGFWTGMLWLAYEYTKDEKYRQLADQNVDSFLHRVENRIELDHHDLGFLYSLSCVSSYRLTGNEKAKRAGILAADKLLERWQEKGEFLQAWGPLNSPEHYRFIIDCMLNLPLLYWASEVTNDSKYKEIAQRHFNTSVNNVIRDDASAYHTFYMDPETGKPSHGATRQGYNDDSSWARGQAWGMYGVPLNIKYVHDTSYTNIYKGMTHYFLNRLPKDNVCYWDLIFNDGDDQSRDSSATAVAVCAIDEMDKYLPKDDADRNVYLGAARTMLKSLMENYTKGEQEPGNPILYHGVYSWHSGKGVDEGNIWGDYYYMEALMRQLKQWEPYW